MMSYGESRRVNHTHPVILKIKNPPSLIDTYFQFPIKNPSFVSRQFLASPKPPTADMP
jgi:hypothetical protein